MYSENKGADQLRSHRETDLRLCFPNFAYAKSRFSHNEAHIIMWFLFEGVSSSSSCVI